MYPCTHIDVQLSKNPLVLDIHKVIRKLKKKIQAYVLSSFIFGIKESGTGGLSNPPIVSTC